MEDLALQSVRKPKAKKTHLTVPAAPDADVRTLCGVDMVAGTYEVVDEAADCQPCLRRRGNRAFISSAYFAQDAGARLLEMSLEQSRKRHAGGTAARAGARPKLSVVGDEAPNPPAGGGAASRVAKAPAQAPEPRAAANRGKVAKAPAPDREAPNDGELRRLGLDGLERVGAAVYRSPAGVLVRIHREQGGWQIAEVTHDGPVSLTARASGRTTTVIGDVRLEEADGGLRMKLTSRRR
jgi:hypothetical protein